MKYKVLLNGALYSVWIFLIAAILFFFNFLILFSDFFNRYMGLKGICFFGFSNILELFGSFLGLIDILLWVHKRTIKLIKMKANYIIIVVLKPIMSVFSDERLTDMKLKFFYLWLVLINATNNHQNLFFIEVCEAYNRQRYYGCQYYTENSHNCDNCKLWYQTVNLV